MNILHIYKHIILHEYITKLVRCSCYRYFLKFEVYKLVSIINLLFFLPPTITALTFLVFVILFIHLFLICTTYVLKYEAYEKK